MHIISVVMNVVSYTNQIVLFLRDITIVLTVTVVVVVEQQESLRIVMKFGIAKVFGINLGHGVKANGGV